jgi:recombination protein RecA
MSSEIASLNSLVAKQLKRQRPKDTNEEGTFDVALSSEDVLSKVEYVLKTGLDPLDEACGGLPFGRIVELYGLESSGKSALCIRSLIKAQIGEIYHRVLKDGVVDLKKVDPARIAVTTVFIDNEQSVDEGEKITVDGVSLECVLSRCDTVDQIFKMSDIVIEKIKEKQDEENKKAKEEKREPIIYFVVLVIDTIAGTSSKQEMTKDWNKEDFQRQPKMLSEGFRRMSRDINRHNVLMVCTNQVRDAFKQSVPGQRKIHYSTPQSDDFSTFGGRALRFYSSMRIFMFNLNMNYKVSGARFSQGLLIGFRTQKNRINKPLREGRLVLLFEGGLNNLYSRLETMIFLGLAKYSPSTKRFTMQFSKFGIVPTTFQLTSSKKSAGRSLEEDDERGRATNDPELDSKREWPAFYAAHQADLDLLWTKAKEIMFSDKPVDSGDVSDDDDDIDMDEE